MHVGAHHGEARHWYRQWNIKNAVFIEAVPEYFAVLKANIDGFSNYYCEQQVCSDQDDIAVEFHIANNEQSSSMFDMAEYTKVMNYGLDMARTVELRTKKLDSIIQEKYSTLDLNFLVIDAQGAELLVLQGATALVAGIDAAFIEVSHTALYVGGATFEAVNDYMEQAGFELRYLYIDPKSNGDGLFIRKNRPIAEFNPIAGDNVALGKPTTQSSYSEFSYKNDQGGVDGIKNGEFGFCTQLERNPWWQVDLLAVYEVDKIVVFNRLNCSERARFMTILTKTNEDDEWEYLYDTAGVNFGGIDGRPLVVSAHGRSVRYVRLQLGTTDYFHLDEVEVYRMPTP